MPDTPFAPPTPAAPAAPRKTAAEVAADAIASADADSFDADLCAGLARGLDPGAAVAFARAKKHERSTPAAAPIYRSPGAPTSSPDAGIDSDPMGWSKDEVHAYERDGTFMTRISKWRASQPGGGGPSLFPNRAGTGPGAPRK